MVFVFTYVAAVALRAIGFVRSKSKQARSCPSLADVAQLVERIHGKDEVTSSILVIGSIEKVALKAAFLYTSFSLQIGTFLGILLSAHF